MPPIDIVAYEPDPDGGWLLELYDHENLDGLPLTMYMHLNQKLAAEFVLIRNQLKMPNDAARQGLDNAFQRLTQNAGKKQNKGATPPVEVQDFMRFYQQHITDFIDRIKLGVTGSAPHSVLEDVRAGRPVEDMYKQPPEDPSARNRGGRASTATDPMDDFINARKDPPVVDPGQETVPDGTGPPPPEPAN